LNIVYGSEEEPSSTFTRVSGIVNGFYGFINYLTTLVGVDVVALAGPPTITFWTWLFQNGCMVVQSFNVSFEEAC